MTRSHELIAFGPVERDARTQLERCLAEGGEEARGVLCADHHKGYSMPIGGVVAYRNHVSPSGVGYDIACGNLAVRTNVTAASLAAADFAGIADEITRRGIVATISARHAARLLKRVHIGCQALPRAGQG